MNVNFSTATAAEVSAYADNRRKLGADPDFAVLVGWAAVGELKFPVECYESKSYAVVVPGDYLLKFPDGRVEGDCLPRPSLSGLKLWLDGAELITWAKYSEMVR